MGGAEDLGVFGPVAGDLVLVEESLRRLIASDPDVVASPMADLFAAGGKRIRPGLLLLAARCGAYNLATLTPAAMAVELTHAATLVHDDVIDRATVRRGRPTVAAQLGDEPAIVVGDFYFAKAYEQAARTDSAEVVAILAQAVMNICAGEVRQQAIRLRYVTGIDEYMRRIEAKTATLLAASCDIGALLGGIGGAQRVALRAYGRSLGLAFQIADDVLDYIGSEEEVGKPIGHDIAEGFATLPLTLAADDPSVSSELAGLLRDGQELAPAEANRVVELVRSSSGPAEALVRAEAFASEARRHLTELPAGDAPDALAALSTYVVSRKL